MMTFAQDAMSTDQIVDEMTAGALMALFGFEMSDDVSVLSDVGVVDAQNATNAFQSVAERWEEQISTLAQIASQSGAQGFVGAGYVLMADRMGEDESIPSFVFEDAVDIMDQVYLPSMMLVEAQGTFAIV